MNSEENLYELQLVQIQIALQTCDNSVDRANLISLKNDLEELISLENVESERLEENICDESRDESLENSKKVKV